MKVKEISVKKSRVREIKKEESKKEDREIEEVTESPQKKNAGEEPVDVKGQDDKIEQFVEDLWTKEVISENKPNNSIGQDFTLEDVVSETPTKTNAPEETRTSGDFYTAKTEDFYSNGNGNNIYSVGGNDLYSANGDDMYSANGKNFYNNRDDENKRVGEIRGEKISKLELEGARGNFKKDKRSSENDKYKTKTY